MSARIYHSHTLIANSEQDFIELEQWAVAKPGVMVLHRYPTIHPTIIVRLTDESVLSEIMEWATVWSRNVNIDDIMVQELGSKG